MSKYLILMLCISSGLNGQHKKRQRKVEHTLLTIGSDPVTVDQFNYLYNKACKNYEAEATEKGLLEYLDEFITFKLKVRAAKNLKMDTARSFQKEYIMYRRDLQQSYLPDGYHLSTLVDKAYARAQEIVKVSYILIKLNPDAAPKDTLLAFNKIMDIKKRVDQGENFTLLAKQLSEDSYAEENKGRIGYFSALHTALLFEDTVYGLKVNEVSEPLRTQFGYNLIKLEDRKPSPGKVEVSHIFIQGHESTAKAKIDKIYEQLQQGIQWDTLCRKYSQDSNTKEKKGRIKPFGRGDLLSAPIFENASFDIAVPGTFTVPIETAFGWHIIRLEKKIPLPPAQQLKRELTKKLMNSPRVQIAKRTARNSQKARWSFMEYALAKKNLMNGIDTILLNNSLRKQIIDKPLFKIKNTVFTTREFLQYTARTITAPKFKNKPSTYFNILYDRFVDKKLDEEEDKILLAKNPDYKNTLREYKEGTLFFAIMKKKIWNRASKDSVGQQQYYKNNTEKYKIGKQVEALIFSVFDKKNKVYIEEKINKKRPIQSGQIAKLDTLRTLKVYTKNDNKIIDAIDWTIGFHGVNTDTVYYLVKITRLLEGNAKKYDEAFGEVILDYQDYLEKKWIDELKEKFPIRVNDKNKRRILRQLKK